MKKITILILISFFSSVINAQDFKSENLKSLADYAIQTIKENDSTSFFKLFKNDLDDNITDTIAIKNLLKDNFYEAHQLFKNKNIEFITYDTSDFVAGGRFVDNDSFNVYVKIGEEFYKMRLTHHTAIKENYFLMLYLNNLSEECKTIKTSEYKPDLLLKRGLKWNNYEGYIFDEVILGLHNMTDFDIDEIKFRLTLTDIENNKIVFHKTINSKQKIYEGDMADISISELKGFRPGFQITQDSFEWSIEFLSVSPRPQNTPCAKIEKLQS